MFNEQILSGAQLSFIREEIMRQLEAQKRDEPHPDCCRSQEWAKRGEAICCSCPYENGTS